MTYFYGTSGTLYVIPYTKIYPNHSDSLRLYINTLNIHDEVQIQVKDEYAERVAEICVSTFLEVTEVFNFRILLEGEAKIGNNWKETH